MAGKVDVLLDTSVLINFARIGRIDLLAAHPEYSFFVTDHVRAEVLEYFREQYEVVTQAVSDGVLSEITVDTAAELEDFGKLVTLKSLGLGECSAISVAKHRSLILAIDDVAASKRARKFDTGLVLLGTEDIMVSLIQEGILTVEQADSIKLDWETNHRFKLRFSTFAERL